MDENATSEGEVKMSNQMQAEIADLNVRLDQLDDPRQCLVVLQERMNQMRSAGWIIPDDIKMMERQLMAECLAESQGR